MDIDFQSYLLLSSVALRKLNEKNLPVACASGCLVDYKGKRFVLTVAHATRNQGKWAIEIKFVPGKGTQLFCIGAMNFLKEIDINQLTSKDIDFSYASVLDDLEPVYQEIQPPHNIINSEIKKVIHSIDFSIVPSAGKTYGFSGLIKPSLENSYFISELMLETGMTFIKSTNEFYEFRLSRNHPGHEHFSGCSGAPIIDNDGRVVALVTHGCIQQNTIYGISLKRYQVALDIEAGSTL